MNYFRDSRLARMSDGTYCIIRDLGLVKGGKGLRHHESLLTLSARGLASRLVHVLQRAAKRLQNRSGKATRTRVARAHE
jgi:hypothetical protein